MLTSEKTQNFNNLARLQPSGVLTPERLKSELENSNIEENQYYLLMMIIGAKDEIPQELLKKYYTGNTPFSNTNHIPGNFGLPKMKWWNYLLGSYDNSPTGRDYKEPKT